MAKIISRMAMADNGKMGITVLGKHEVRAGQKAHDEQGRTFVVVGIGMLHYKNPADIGKYTEVVLYGDDDIGNEIFL